MEYIGSGSVKDNKLFSLIFIHRELDKSVFIRYNNNNSILLCQKDV